MARRASRTSFGSRIGLLEIVSSSHRGAAVRQVGAADRPLDEPTDPLWLSGRRFGFTIVELLIVVVVIAILVAITVVAYRGVTDNAKVSGLKSELSQQAKKLALWKTRNAEQYPADLNAAQTAGLLVDSSNADYTTYIASNAATPAAFCATAVRDGVVYSISSTSSTPVSGECVTNLHPNPRVSVNANGWSVSNTGGSTGAQTIETTGGPTGVGSFYRRTISSSPTSSPLAVITTGSGVSSIPVLPSTTYRISAYFRCSFALTSGFRIDVSEYDIGGAQVSSTSQGSTSSMSINQWQQLSRTFTTSPSTSYLRVMLNFSGPIGAPAGSTFDMTGVMVTAGSSTYPYADGDLPGWTWDATIGNSSSTGPL